MSVAEKKAQEDAKKLENAKALFDRCVKTTVKVLSSDYFCDEMAHHMESTYKEVVVQKSTDATSLANYANGEETVTPERVSTLILSSVHATGGFGLGCRGFTKWKQVERARLAAHSANAAFAFIKDEVLATFIKNHTKWDEMSDDLDNVINKLPFVPLKLCLVYTKEEEYTELLLKNPLGVTVLEVALEVLHKDHKFGYFMYTEIQWLEKWDTTWDTVYNAKLRTFFI